MPASGSWPGAGDGLAQEKLPLFPDPPTPRIAEVPEIKRFRGRPPAWCVPTTASSLPSPNGLAPAGCADALFPLELGSTLRGGLCIPGCFVNSQTRCSASRQMGRHRGVSIGANWWRRQLGLCAAPEPNQTRPLYPGTLGLGGGDRRWMPSLAGPRSPQGCPIPLPCSGSCSLARFQPRGGKGCGSQSPAFGTRVGGDALQRVFWSCRDKFR